LRIAWMCIGTICEACGSHDLDKVDCAQSRWPTPSRIQPSVQPGRM